MRSDENIKNRIAAEDKLCELLRICRRGALEPHQSAVGERKRGGRARILPHYPHSAEGRAPRRGVASEASEKFFRNVSKKNFKAKSPVGFWIKLLIKKNKKKIKRLIKLD